MSEKAILIIFYGNPDYYPPTINAIKLLSEKYKVHIVCRNHKKIRVMYPANVEILRTGRFLDKEKSASQSFFRKAFEYLSFFMLVCRESLLGKYKVILAYDMHAFAVAFWAKFLSSKCRLIYHCHDTVEWGGASGFMKMFKYFELNFSKHADEVIFPNRNRAKDFQSKAKLKKEPLIVPNTHLIIEEIPRGILRKELGEKGYDATEPIVLHQGIICENQYSLNVVESVKHWDGGIFVMIGDYERDMEERIHSLIRENNLIHRVYILDYISYDSLIEYTVDADIGLALYKPSNINLKFYADASCKINDYIAVGIPVIANESTDCREVYSEDIWLQTVDADNIHEIAKAVNFWIQNKEKHDEAKKAARRKHLRISNYENSFKDVMAYIDRVMHE